MKTLPRQLASIARYDLGAMVRWLSLCAFVGIASGCAAALFVTAMEELQVASLDRFVGVVLARPAGEAAPREVGPPIAPRWLLPLVPALGGLACGLIALRVGRDFTTGTNLVIAAYNEKARTLEPSIPLAKWIASLLTLGTGGSAGREGPMSLVGAGIGSITARLFGVGDRERRLLLLAGGGAAVGAIFRVPFGSAIFAIEMLYMDGFEEEGIFPCLIASVSAYSAFIAFHGAGHLFDVPQFPPFRLASVPLFALVGLMVVPFGLVFVLAMRVIRVSFARLRLPHWSQPAIGGLLVGAMGLFIHPELLGVGYGWVQQVLAPVRQGQTSSLSVAGLFLLFAFGKILATSLTVGSGGSGGKFAPVIVVGGFVGGAVGQALHVLVPGLAPQPAAFALVGMGALVGGLAHVPMAAVVMICELAGNYDLLVPIMVAVGISYLLFRRVTLYPAQAATPAASPARAGGLALDALGTLKVSDLVPLRTAAEPVSANMPLQELIAMLAERPGSIFPVHDGDGRVRRMVTLAALHSVLDASQAWPSLLVDDAAIPLISVKSTDSVHRVLEVLVATGTDDLLVLADDAAEILGVVGHEDVARLTLQEAMRRKADARKLRRELEDSGVVIGDGVDRVD